LIKDLRSIFIHSDEVGRFDFGLGHPLKPERGIKAYDLCIRYGLMGHPWMGVIEPSPLDPSILTRFHDPAYLELLRKASKGEVSLDMLERGLGNEDNPVLPGIFEWSLKVAGGTSMSMEMLISCEVERAFNPYGGFHHAMADHAEGFCYINDIVIAIMEALEKGKRIAYIDIDAHHGNGVQDAFYRDPRLLFISLHETGRTLYPWSGMETEKGEGEGRGFTVNIPLEPGTDDEVYLYAFQEVVPPLLNSFSPDIIVALLGADTMISDPLTHLRLTNNGYQEAVRIISSLCPKVLALGGGGYDIYRTARCWTLAWAILNGLQPRDEYAGVVGGMMFGPEMEVGSLYDYPYRSEGQIKEKAFNEARRVVRFIQGEIFPIHGISKGV
jgi:acetoin utilization protein AcuC